MKRKVDVATSPHTYSSTPNIFFSIVLLPEKSSVEEFTKKYKKGDFYIIQGKKKRKEKTRSQVLISEEISQPRSECCSVCSCCERAHSSTAFEPPRKPRRLQLESSRFSRSQPRMYLTQFESTDSQRSEFHPTEFHPTEFHPTEFHSTDFHSNQVPRECIECNNNCSRECTSHNFQQNNLESSVQEDSDRRKSEIMIEMNRRKSEIIREEILMRDSIRNELMKSVKHEEVREEGCFKKSIPCLLTPAAVVFCLLNFFLPGSGTLFSSLSILIFGCETGYGMHRWKRAFMVSLIASLIQFTTCLIVIGWVWSIMWGIDLVTKSSNYNCDKDNIFEEEESEFQRRMDEKKKNEKDIIAKETRARESQAKETVMETDTKARRKIQFLDTYLSRNRHMEQMI